MKEIFFLYLDNKLKINSKKFSLIIGAKPSQGARSPKLWNKVYKKKKINCKMYPADVKNLNLKNLVSVLKKNKNFIGGSVTIPHKEKILKYLDHVDLNSKKIGSINTILKKGEKIIGINTDYLGFANSFKNFKIKKKDTILILGAGGAAKSVISFVMNKCNSNRKYFFNRNKLKLASYLKKFNNKNVNVLKNYIDINRIRNVKLVINATSVGFDTWFNDKNCKYFNYKFFTPLGLISKINPVKKKNFREFFVKNKDNILNNLRQGAEFFKNNPKCKVYDIIYTPKKTQLMQSALKLKNYTLNGLDMNLDQAVIAFSKVNSIKSIEKIKSIMKK